MEDQKTNKKDILLCFYKEHLAQARQQESQRATMTNLILIIGAAVIGLITLDKSINNADLLLSIFLTFLGLYGAVFSAKLYERFRLHYERSRNTRFKIEELYPETTISIPKADEKTKENYPILFRLRLFWLWMILPYFIFLLGIILTLKAVFS